MTTALAAETRAHVHAGGPIPPAMKPKGMGVPDVSRRRIGFVHHPPHGIA